MSAALGTVLRYDGPNGEAGFYRIADTSAGQVVTMRHGDDLAYPIAVVATVAAGEHVIADNLHRRATA